MVVLALAMLAVVAGPARAAAPNATDDALTAFPTGALDVLANDSDPDGPGDLTVTATTQPANGTVTCSSLGACFFTAAGGFTGSNSFTYTVSDSGGATDTATVSVTVSASTAAQAILAVDDDVATLAGRAIDFNALTNDRGAPPLTLQSSTTPSHGTTTCGSDGACHYEPAAGFTGRDGFTYVLRDNTSATRTAALHIAVAPAGSTIGLSAGGFPLDPSAGGLVPSGGGAGWFAFASPDPTGLASDELKALPLPSITSALDGPQTLVAGSTGVASGWNVDTPGNASATANALIGGAVSQLFPRPLPPISQGTGGAGHVPILVGTKVFAFFLHSLPTSAACVDRLTGTTCPGYMPPKQLNVGASDINGPGAVTGSKIWWHALLSGDGSFSQTASKGLYCWDASADSPCGMTIVERVPSTIEIPGSHPVLADGKMWFGANTGKLYCLEPDTGARCATPSLNTGVTGGTGCMSTPSGLPCMDIITHGTRVFVSLSGGEVACLDVAALTTCPGWSSPKSFGGGDWNIVNKYNASGSAVGICVVDQSGGNAECVDDATPGTTTPITNWPTSPCCHYEATQEAETGTRTLMGTLARGGLGCYDWTTMARCTGGGYDADGWLDKDKDGASLPSAFGAIFDGACAIALGDPGQVFTVDPAGVSPCTRVRSGFRTQAIDLRTQRCDNTVGGARWKTVVLTDSDATELDSLAVTVRDAGTGAVLKTGDLVGGTLDISDIDPVQHPAIVVDASAQAKDATVPWDDGIPPRIVVNWTPDPRHVCVQTKATAECSADATSVLGFRAHLANPAKDAGASLLLRRVGCPVPVPPEVQSPPAPLAFGARTLVTLTLVAKRIPARGPLTVRVANANVFAVTGTLSGRTTKRVSLAQRKRRVTLRAKSFNVAAKTRKTVKLKLPRALRRLLAREGKLSLRLTAKVKDPAGNSRTVTKRVSPRLMKKRTH
jgi:hypothetical protein